jgi:transcription initiation factor TFIIIB Brf1 subunit/transcription initiation factor TFIIB
VPTIRHDPLANVSGKFITCPYCKREIVTDAYVTHEYLAISCEKCKTVLEAELFELEGCE